GLVICVTLSVARPRLVADEGVVVFGRVESACRIAKETVERARGVEKACHIAEEAVATTCRIRGACTTADEGVEAGLVICVTQSVALPRLVADEGVLCLDRVVLPGARSRKQIVRPRGTQDTRAAEVELRRGIDNIARERAASGAITADVE